MGGLQVVQPVLVLIWVAMRIGGHVGDRRDPQLQSHSITV